jgi:heme/copper-type cytochrome/quinol oxidase subunit 3
VSRSEFLVFWGLVLIAISLFILGAVRLRSRVFRGATVIMPGSGETQEMAEARADRSARRMAVFVVTITTLACYAFIVWQATLLY